MWIFSKIGFFSVVVEGKEKEQDLLSVRARVRADLERLKKDFLPNSSDIVEIPGRDYPYRVWAWKTDVAAAMGRLMLDVDYHNFKSAVTKNDGNARHDLYMKVWGVMNGAESKLKDMNAEDRKRNALFKSSTWKNDDASSGWGRSSGAQHSGKSKKKGRAYTTDSQGTLLALDSLREPSLPADEPGAPGKASAEFPADPTLPVWPDKPHSEKTVGSMQSVACPWCGQEITDLEDFVKPGLGRLEAGTLIECDVCGSTCEIGSVMPNKVGVEQVTLKPASTAHIARS